MLKRKPGVVPVAPVAPPVQIAVPASGVPQAAPAVFALLHGRKQRLIQLRRLKRQQQTRIPASAKPQQKKVPAAAGLAKVMDTAGNMEVNEVRVLEGVPLNFEMFHIQFFIKRFF